MPSKPRGPTTPQDFPTSPSILPSGDYSYTVELVGAIQNQLGKLTEAVDALKEQSKSNSGELKNLAKDFHAAKAVGKALLWLVGVVGALVGIFLSAYARQLFGGGR